MVHDNGLGQHQSFIIPMRPNLNFIMPMRPKLNCQ